MHNEELAQEARRWAFRNQYIRVYPVPINKTYKDTYNGKKINFNYVNLCIEIGNAKHIGKEVYKQNSKAIKEKTDEIYIHYYQRK